MENEWGKRINQQQSPLLVMWEMTRTCGLKCLHCQIKNRKERTADDLTFAEGIQLIDEIAEMGTSYLVLTGGDIFLRPDFFALAQHGVAQGLKVIVRANATKHVTKDVMNKVKEIGVSKWEFNLDGPDTHSHNALCGEEGIFEQTMHALSYFKKIGLPRQINTVVSKINLDKIEEIGNLIKTLDIELWDLIMMVPTPGNSEITPLTASEHELFFQWLYDYSRKVPFRVKTTYGEHFQRVVIQNKARQMRLNTYEPKYQSALREGTEAVNKLLEYDTCELYNGRSSIYINHRGDVYPSCILPIKAGNVKDELLNVIYRYSPLLKKLNNPDLLKGKCGVCEFRYVCGGNRSRAYNLTGDYLESEPYCLYMPAKAYQLQEKIIAK